MGLGSGIRDPRSGIRKKPIPDPGSGVKKAPDPESQNFNFNHQTQFKIVKAFQFHF
jgi:hypothetical protein